MHFYEGHAAPLYISHAVAESFPYLFTVITIYLFCFQCVQNVRKLREENMSDENSNPQSNSSDTYKKLLQVIRDLESKDEHGSSFAADNKDNETMHPVETGNAIKENTRELQTSDEICSGHRILQVLEAKMQKKRMYNLQEKVVPSRSSASLCHNPRLFNLLSKNEKVSKEKPETFDKKSMDEFLNCRETDRDRRDTSIIQASKRGDYTTIPLPPWIPSCL